ncbi:MAG: hypothetical protein AAF726_15840 [Planctomycetota bacterium]
MLRIKIAAALALPLAVACTTPEQASEPVEPQAAATPTTEGSETAEVLDPNDPDVLVCPITGAMQRKSDADGDVHGEDGHGDGYGESYDDSY